MVDAAPDAAARPDGVAGAVAKGLASLTGARAISFTLQFVTFGILATHLGPKGFGVYTFGLAFARLFGVVTNFGLKQVVTRDAAQNAEDEPWLIPNFFYLRLVLGAVAFVALVAGVAIVGYPDAEQDAALAAGTLLLLMALGSFSAVLEVRLQMKWVAIADIAEAVLLLAAVALLQVADAGPVAMIWAYVVVNVVNGLIVLVAALRTTSFHWRPLPSRWVPLGRAAIPLGMAAVLGMIYYQLDVAILARFHPGAEVGQYGAAYRFLDAANVLPVILMVVLNPVLARSVAEGGTTLQRRFGSAVHLVSLVATPIAVVGALASWRALPTVPGFGEYGRGGIALSILAPTAAAIFVTMVVQGVLVSAHRQSLLLRIALTGAITETLLNLLLIPEFGLYAAAGTTTFTEIVVFGLSMWMVHRRVGISWPTHRLPGLLAAAAVTAAVAVAGLALPPLVQVAVALVSWPVAAGAFGALHWRDLGGLLRMEGDEVALAAPDLEVGQLVPPAGAAGPAVAGGIRSARRATASAGSCTMHAGPGVPWRALLGARVARCGRVVVIDHAPERGRLSRAIIRLFADELEPASR